VTLSSVRYLHSVVDYLPSPRAEPGSVVVLARVVQKLTVSEFCNW